MEKDEKQKELEAPDPEQLFETAIALLMKGLDKTNDITPDKRGMALLSGSSLVVVLGINHIPNMVLDRLAEAISKEMLRRMAEKVEETPLHNCQDCDALQNCSLPPATQYREKQKSLH